ncbi:MAG: group II intron reverse transcriptase/maturase [Polyangiaceae bacterium]|nr:group II intron reverse transcriptase/maturase [Polyangiaceae bacterium]
MTFEKSDEAIVPAKSAKMRVMPFESMEGKAEAKGNSAARNASSTPSEQDAPTALQRIQKRAITKPKNKWTNLLSHLTAPLLRGAYHSLRKRAAAGVDGVTWEAYGERLDERLTDLVDRIHRGSYHPQPVRRVEIPKGNGSTRPLGIPALEDKIVQQAVRWLLEPIYEAEFVGFSYGFRPKRSAHDALDAFFTALHRRVNWVLDADIRSFFDTIEHEWMQKFVEHRIGDRRLVRLLMKWMKWMKAGVMKDGKLYGVTEGTPQGGIISPLLANIYLHYVLDLWVQSWRKKHARGDMYVVRYADDFVMGFQLEQDAHAMRQAMSERLAKFGLELHPDKTRVLEFGRFALQNREQKGLRRPETFTFLGFVHLCGRRRNGMPQFQRRTSPKKMRASLARIKEECRKRRHLPVLDQYAWLRRVVTGHVNYYGVPSNAAPLHTFYREVTRIWHRSLQRRSQRGKWREGQRQRFIDRFPLPDPRIVHPWPMIRFFERHPQGGSPVREIRSPGSVRGAR